jgi:uncharacterized membrane protein
MASPHNGSAGQRLAGIDAARGLALLGMMATHIFPLWTSGANPEPNFTGLVFSGRSSALFAVLAGVGLGLLTGGSRPHSGRSLLADRSGIAVRAAIIALVGLMLGTLNVSIAVILVHYAVLFLCALPFLQLRLPVLAAWAGGWLVLSPVAAYLLRPWLENTLGLESLGHNPMILDVFIPSRFLADIFVTGYYPVLQWLGYILVGLVIGRLDIRRAAVQLWLLSGGLAAAALAKAGSWLIMDGMGGYRQLASTEAAERADFALIYQVNLSWVDTDDSWWWLGISGPHSGTTFDLLHTSGTAAVVLAICLLLTTKKPNLLLPLSGAGAMTLTLYSVHVWVMSLIPKNAAWPGDNEIYWVQVIVALSVGTTLKVLDMRGPFEFITSTASRATRDAIRGGHRQYS